MQDTKNVVVKSNSLILAGYKLTVAENRLLLLANARARASEKGLYNNDDSNGDSLLKITTGEFAKVFEVKESNAFKSLKIACDQLFERRLTYNRDDCIFTKRWVHEIGFDKNGRFVFIRFSEDITPMITRLNNNFTVYDLEQIDKLKSQYSIRIYEIMLMWYKINPKKSPTYTIEEFREMLGFETFETLEESESEESQQKKPKYTKMCDFKKYVLDLAVLQINEHSNMTISYKNIKRGRNIIAFQFKVRVEKIKNINPIRDLDTPDFFTGKTDNESNKPKQHWKKDGLSDKQINRIAVEHRKIFFLEKNEKALKYFGAFNESTNFEAFNKLRPYLKDKANYVHFKSIQETLDMPDVT